MVPVSALSAVLAAGRGRERSPARKRWGGEKVQRPPLVSGCILAKVVALGHISQSGAVAERLIHDRYPQVTPRQHQKHQKDSTFGESKPRGSAVITRYRVPGGSGVDPGLIEGPAGDLSQYKVGHK